MASASLLVHKNYELDCQYLHCFFSGNDTSNQQKLVKILASRNLEELKLIRQLYRSLYNEELLHHLINNTWKNNEFARVVYLRLSEPNERDAELLRNAVFGSSVNLSTVIEILCSRPSLELQSVKQAYLSRYNSDIEQDIALKINGGFKEILIAVLKSSRCYNGKVDMSMAMCDAKTLYEAMESGKCIDEKTIISFMSQRSTGQLKSVLVSYKQLYGHEFSKSLKRNKCGQFGKELRTVIRCIQYPDKYFAKKLRKTTSNSDVREVLFRTIITRSGIDIKDTNHAYTSKAGCSLESLVRRKFEEILAEFLVELLQRC